MHGAQRSGREPTPHERAAAAARRLDELGVSNAIVLNTAPAPVRRGGLVTVTAFIPAHFATLPTAVGVICTEKLTQGYVGTGGETGLAVGDVKRRYIVYADWSRVYQHERLIETAFALPADAPFSYKGGRIQLTWNAVVLQRRRWRRDRKTEREITVLP
jgi:hypothetical protein